MSMSKKLKKELRIIILAAVLFFAILIAEKAGLLPAVFGNRWLTLVLYLIPYLLVGYDVLRKAVLGIAHGQMLDESFLMTIASIGAFVTGENEEAAAVMLFYQVGEWFQRYALGKSRESIAALMDIAPENANIEQEDGSVEEADPEEVEVGNILVIRPGEKIPVDGEVISGSSLVNTAALTGESVPRTVRPGDEVISGCINGEGMLRIRATKCYEDSTVAKILELVENATEKKSRTENFITRFARYYTPAVVIGAVLLALIPSLVTGDPLTWIYRACTFLVISCPCALVISVPLAFFGGIGAASRNGVLVKGSNYLEQLAKITTLVTDKTGTLTEGNFKVSALLPAEGVTEEVLLENAALAEQTSTHPIALSVLEAYRTERILAEYTPEQPGKEKPFGNEVTSDELLRMDIEHFREDLLAENIPGKGIRVTVGEDRILAGNGKLLSDEGIFIKEADEADATVTYIAKNGQYLGAILIRDEIKKDANDAVAQLKANGVKRVVMLTGDRAAVAEAVGKKLSIDRVYAELLPQEKVERVETLLAASEKKGEILAYVGDGINDAPTLSRADVGIAMGSLGSDAAIEAADVVIMDDDLLRLPKVIGIARKTVAVSKQNIVFALVVKAVILLLGALGLAGMWAAVFADVGVAVLCILNSMRLLLVKRTI